MRRLSKKTLRSKNQKLISSFQLFKTLAPRLNKRKRKNSVIETKKKELKASVLSLKSILSIFLIMMIGAGMRIRLKKIQAKWLARIKSKKSIILSNIFSPKTKKLAMVLATSLSVTLTGIEAILILSLKALMLNKFSLLLECMSYFHYLV